LSRCAPVARTLGVCARLVVLCVCVFGCASTPRSPYFGDEQFLTFGVDPDSEARVVIADLEASGHALRARTRGRYFVALGFDEGGRPGIVRIVTARGIGFALDAVKSDALQPGVRYRLLLPPDDLAPDVDGDGNEEVFVAVLPYDGGEPCLAAYRVKSDGSVERVLTDIGASIPSAAPWSRLLLCETPASPPEGDQEGEHEREPKQHDHAPGTDHAATEPAPDAAQGAPAKHSRKPHREAPEVGDEPDTGANEAPATEPSSSPAP